MESYAELEEFHTKHFAVNFIWAARKSKEIRERVGLGYSYITLKDH